MVALAQDDPTRPEVRERGTAGQIVQLIHRQLLETFYLAQHGPQHTPLLSGSLGRWTVEDFLFLIGKKNPTGQW